MAVSTTPATSWRAAAASLLNRLWLFVLLVLAPALAQSTPAPDVEKAIQTRLQASNQAERYGNFSAALNISLGLAPLVDQLMTYPESAETARKLRNQGFVRRLSSFVHTGGAPDAILFGERLIKLARGEQQLEARVWTVAAAREAARPKAVDSHLTLLEGELPAFREHALAPIWNFAARSWAAERELQKQPDLPLDTLLARHDAAWKALGDFRGSDLGAGDGRLYWDCVKIWTTELQRRLQLTSGADHDRVLALYNADVERSRALSRAVRNPEYITGMLGFAADNVAGLTRDGSYAAAHQALEELTPEVQSYAARLTEADRAQAAEPEAFRFSVFVGDYALIQSGMAKLRLRLLLAEKGGKLSPEEQQVALNEVKQGVEFQKDIKFFMGLNDFYWELANYLFTVRPDKWQERVTRMVAIMLETTQNMEDRAGVIAAWAYDGELKASLGDKPGAIASLKKSTGLAEEYIIEVGAAGSGADQIRSRYRRAYELLTQLLIESGQSHAAYDTLGRLQQMEARPATDAALKGNPILTQAAELRGQTDALRQQIASGKAAGQDTAPTEKLLAQTKAEFFTALGEIRRTNPQYESLLGIRPVNFSKQQGTIPANAAIVQYFPADDGLYIFLVTREALKIRKVAVKSADLQTAVLAFRRAIVGRQDITEPSLQLHSWLIDPVEKDVARKTVLAFIPTGTLSYLPFPALARKQGARLEYLAQRKQCAVLLKSSDLDQLGHKPSAARAGVLALGNPDGSLPAATQEVQEIAGLFGGKPHVGAEARRDWLTGLQKGGTAYLHLATHGTMDTRDPAASYLLLAGDSRLLVPQIYGYTFKDVRLVTLSACQTALAERDPGSELQSLAEAFGVAGTNSVVASYWSVADDSTRALMVEFYKGLKAGRSLAQALNSAQLSLLKSPKYSHPFYWAPFVLIGDWR